MENPEESLSTDLRYAEANIIIMHKVKYTLYIWYTVSFGGIETCFDPVAIICSHWKESPIGPFQ